jgi:hypothetical protein
VDTTYAADRPERSIDRRRGRRHHGGVTGQLLAAASGPGAGASGPASTGLVVLTGVVAFFVVAAAWALVQAGVIIAHEGGHALVGSAVGGKVLDITIERTSGLTNVLLKDPFKRFLLFLAGYLAPPLFGVGGAMLLSTGRVRPLLWLSLFLVACALVMAEGWSSAVRIAITGGLIFLVIRYAGGATQVFFAYTWIWYLLFGGIRAVLVLAAAHAEGPNPTSDAGQLRQLSLLPAKLFVGFFGLASFAALVAGGLIMVGAIGPGSS